MATTTRYSVAKTIKSYSPAGVNAVLGSTVYSATEQWLGGIAYGNPEAASPESSNTTRLTPTS